MRPRNAVRIVTYGLLVGACGLNAMLPQGLTLKNASANDPVDSVRLWGTIRDFRREHVDFNVLPQDGYGHYAGNVTLWLDDEMRPVFNVPSDVITEFDIVNQQVIPGQDFAIEVTVVGSAIETGDYHMPVTAKAHVGSQTLEPFGPYDSPVQGNLNDDQSETGGANPGENPRVSVLDTVFEAGSVIAVTARSWEKEDDSDSGLLDEHWTQSMTASTLDGGPQVKVLRNGDPVPDIEGAFDQVAVADYIEDYIDFSTNTISIEDHQAIFLFEVGVGADEDGADFQDLVALVSLATHPSYFLNDDSEGGEDVIAGGGFRVEDQWRDREGRPIAPHLFMNGAPPPVQLAQAPTLANHAEMDSFNPDLGPYGGANSGPVPEIEIGGTMPAVTIPTGLPYEEELRCEGGTVMLVADVHCGKLEVRGGATLQVEGDVTVVVDDLMKLENQGAIRLSAGSTLTVYCRGDTRLDTKAAVNVESHDPSLVEIYVQGEGDLHIHNQAQVYATIVAPDATLSLHNHADLAGSFAGRSIDLNNHAALHVGNAAPSDACGIAIEDEAGLAGVTSTGGINSDETFAQWFTDSLGTNMSTAHSIVLMNDGTGVYEYSDPEFHPIDGRLLGDEGDEHNYYFTFGITTQFVYNACGQQFFEFEGADDAWLFIDGRLVMDLGGVLAESGQHVDLDRLGLADGETYSLAFFYAQRQSFSALFHMRTNIPLVANPTVTAGGGYD